MIIYSLIGMVIAGVAIFVFRDAGTAAFWAFGLALTMFVGPVQSASRALLARLTPADRATEMFGLYATTGRAASFLAPTAFAVFVTVTKSQSWGIIGLTLVLLVGLVLLLFVRFPAGRGVGGRKADREQAAGN